MEALGINLGYLLAFALAFGIMFVVLRAWVFVPLLNVLERRRIEIARGLEDARIAADARANAEEEANRIINEAQTRASEVLREATERAEKVEHEIRSQAESEVVKSREAARAELESERNRMLSELRGQIVSLAIAAAQKLISENLDEKRQHALVNEFFSGVRSGEVSVLRDVSADGSQNAEITSALPLTESEQDEIRRAIAEKVGREVIVHYRVDPTILGGLIMRIGDRVVDGSVSGRLEELRHSMR